MAKDSKLRKLQGIIGVTTGYLWQALCSISLTSLQRISSVCSNELEWALFIN